jgi:nucleoside-diphosphate-sugar epimerase
VANNWQRETVFITGATGMIGANLVRRLVALGCRPFVLARSQRHRERLAEIENELVWLQGDVTDANSIAVATTAAKPTIVFHLAGSFFNPPTLSAAEHMAVNSAGTLNVCEALKKFEGSRLVIAGSCSVYAGGERLREDAPMNPGSMFGVSKAAGAMIARSFGRLHGINTVELRLFGPFGPWENARRIIPGTILSALAGRDLTIGHGGQQRDFVYMDDVVDAFLLAATAPNLPPDLVVNIGGGLGRSIRDVAARILELMGNPIKIIVGAKPVRADEIWTMSADITAAERHLGWRPKFDFDEGLRRTIAWFREHRALEGILT